MTHGENVWNALLHGRWCLWLHGHFAEHSRHDQLLPTSVCSSRFQLLDGLYVERSETLVDNACRPLGCASLIFTDRVSQTIAPAPTRRSTFMEGVREDGSRSHTVGGDGERLRDNDNTAQTVRTMISDVEDESIERRNLSVANHGRVQLGTRNQCDDRASGINIQHLITKTEWARETLTVLSSDPKMAISDREPSLGGTNGERWENPRTMNEDACL